MLLGAGPPPVVHCTWAPSWFPKATPRHASSRARDSALACAPRRQLPPLMSSRLVFLCLILPCLRLLLLLFPSLTHSIYPWCGARQEGYFSGSCVALLNCDWWGFCEICDCNCICLLLPHLCQNFLLFVLCCLFSSNLCDSWFRGSVFESIDTCDCRFRDWKIL